MVARWILAALIGIAIAAVVGALAWLLSPIAPELSGAVFAGAALPFGLVLGWILLIAPKSVRTAPHSPDSIESSWLNTALAGTATDVVLVTGLALTAISITRLELPTQLVLLGILLVAFGSTAVRYSVARMRAA